METPKIICPKCKSAIELTEAMAGPLIAQAQKDFAIKLDQAKTAIAIDARKEATEQAAIALKAAQDEAAELKRKAVANSAKLQEAASTMAAATRLQRELEDQQRELALTVERNVSEKVAVIRSQAAADAANEYGLKVADKQRMIDNMKTQMEEMQRKIDQGSQQSQGEILELELEAELRREFVFDEIVPVPKGVFGGDVIHKVRDGAKDVGTILWEFKRTKNWNDGWLAKLRGDQRNAKAEIAVITTTVLPEGIKTFGLIEAVWVTSPSYAIALCHVLRSALSQVDAARNANVGRETKMELVYQYLTGQEFAHRISAIVEHVSGMTDDLENERKALEKSWAKREKSIKLTMKAAAGMFGDLQGIAGAAIAELPGLDVKALSDGGGVV
jgi:hypothetical protein